MNWDLRTSKWKLNFHEVRSGTKKLITEFSEKMCSLRIEFYDPRRWGEENQRKQAYIDFDLFIFVRLYLNTKLTFKLFYTVYDVHEIMMLR